MEMTGLFEKTVRDRYAKLTKLLIEKDIGISTMESCTGGMIASLITDTEGASGIIKGAFVTYSNEAKIHCGVPEETIFKYTVYSKETAEAMAASCRRCYAADIGVGITGTFANPDPQNPSPLRKVWFAIETDKGCYSFEKDVLLLDSRHEYKLFAANEVCNRLLEIINKEDQNK